jgi:hypothetical protein
MDLQYAIARKSVLWEQRRYVQKDRRTDMTKVIGVFRNLCKHTPNNLDPNW